MLMTAPDDRERIAHEDCGPDSCRLFADLLVARERENARLVEERDRLNTENTDLTLAWSRSYGELVEERDEAQGKLADMESLYQHECDKVDALVARVEALEDGLRATRAVLVHELRRQGYAEEIIADLHIVQSADALLAPPAAPEGA